MVVRATIELEVVGAVVEGGHAFAAFRAGNLAVPLGIFNHAASRFLAGRGGLQFVELVGIQPAATAGLAAIDLDPAMAFDDELSMSSWAIHGSSLTTWE